MSIFIEQYKNLLLDIENVFDISGLSIPDKLVDFYVNNIAEVVYKDNYWDDSNNNRYLLPNLTFEQIKNNPKFEDNKHILEKYFKTLYVSGYEEIKTFMGDERVEYINSQTAKRLFTELMESKNPIKSDKNNDLPDVLKNTQIGKMAEDIMKDIDISKIEKSANPMMATMELLPDIMASFNKKIQNNELDINQIQNESMGVLSQFMPMAKMMEPFLKQMINSGGIQMPQMPPQQSSQSGKNKSKKQKKKIMKKLKNKK